MIKNNRDEKPIKKSAGKLSQAIITIESILYSIAVYLLVAPAYVALYAYKCVVYLAKSLPSWFLWLIDRIVLPVLTIIYKGIVFCAHSIILGFVAVLLAIGKVAEWIVEHLVLSLLALLYHSCVFLFKAIHKGIRVLCSIILTVWGAIYVYWSKINWCAVRSTIRIITIICMIGAIYTIIDGVLKVPVDTAIITGRFFDPNGDVFRIHEAIALLMISITAFYNAWAYSKDEEVAFVCTHVVGVSTLRKIRNKILK